MGIPQGYVFVAKGEGVAAGLLNAADKIKADRKMGVRTTMGGYYALEEIAAEYSKQFGPAEVVLLDGSAAPAGDDGIPVLTESAPDDSWKVAEIDAYAEREGIDLTGAKNKKDKLALINQTANKAEE